MYTFEILETRNPDEWFAIIVATEAGTGKRWELLDSVLWLPVSNYEADSFRQTLQDLQDHPPESPGEYWQER